MPTPVLKGLDFYTWDENFLRGPWYTSKWVTHQRVVWQRSMKQKVVVFYNFHNSPASPEFTSIMKDKRLLCPESHHDEMYKFYEYSTRFSFKWKQVSALDKDPV